MEWNREPRNRTSYIESINMYQKVTTEVAQLVKLLTLAQVMISQFMGSSPVSVSVLTTQSLELASDSVSPSFSAPPLVMLCLSVSLKNK